MIRTALSHLADEELQRHVFNKENVTDEELELAHRFELLLDSYQDLLANVQAMTHNAIGANGDLASHLKTLQALTAPVHKAPDALVQ